MTHTLTIVFFHFFVFYCQTLKFLSFGTLALLVPTFQPVAEVT